MNKRKITLIISLALVATLSLVLAGNAISHKSTVVKTPIDNPVVNTNDDPVVVSPEPAAKLSCYDAIDKMLVADGFHYLEGTKWGRGMNNLFIVDFATMEFQMADVINTHVVPENWYATEYDRYVNVVYKYNTNKITSMAQIHAGASEEQASFDQGTLTTNNAYYLIKGWMDHYVEQSSKFGCPVEGLTEAKLNEYKVKPSKATAKDIVSVFDVKSPDGVLRTFADVHIKGDVKQSPRYHEIQSMEELMKLKEESGFEGYYLVNILNSDPKKVYDAGDCIQANAIREFVKDVVFPNTLSRAEADAQKVNTIGIYFIDVDNPNGNFKSMYVKPVKGVGFNYTGAEFGKDLRNFRMPYAGTVIGVEKNPATGYAFQPFNIHEIAYALQFYISYTEDCNPNVHFAEDFVYNYTRPFDEDWQFRFGLTELFDQKYGFINHDIQYVN
ncbi:MAG: hypothetical protein AB9921_02470 [Erysipelotrichaceae bacterium]